MIRPTQSVLLQACGKVRKNQSALTINTCTVSEDLLFYVLFNQYLSEV